MGQRLDEFKWKSDVTKLDELENALRREQPRSRDDRVWLVSELRKAWDRLAESEAWIPVDPSRIG